MQELTQPTLLLKPFAEDGDKNTIPVNATGTNLASLSEGFPPITSNDPDDGGLPPVRADFNGLGNLTTTYDYFYQAGGTFTFNQTVSNAIGGYPLGARLWFKNSNGETSILRSTIGNNTDNFNDGQETGVGTTWVKDTPTFSDFENLRTSLQNYVSSKVPKNIGSGTRPTYTNENGVLTASSSTVGSANRPVYLNNGVLTQCSRVVGFPFPQWGSAISFTSNVNYTVPSNGWVIFDGTAATKFYAFYVYVNDVEVLQAHTGDYAKYPIIFPVNQGQRVRISDSTFRARFVPAVYG